MSSGPPIKKLRQSVLPFVSKSKRTEQGINRHFQMVFLHDKFNRALDRKISSKEIWNHLMEMYDLNSLNESDGLPFRNTESEFSITDAVSADLIDKPFPRSTLCEESKSGSESAKRKDTAKETAGTTTTMMESLSHKDSVDSTPLPPRSAKPSVEASEASKSGPAADLTKTDNRKRTRQSLQSPMQEATTTAASSATPTSTPSSVKRSRRI